MGWEQAAVQGGIGLGSLIGSSVTAKKGREQSEKQQLADQQFQIAMSSTAYQRAVTDMKAAGLNPAMMYAAKGGSQASAPTGGHSLSQMKPDYNLLTEGLKSGISTAVDQRRLRKEEASVDSQIKKEAALKLLYDSQTLTQINSAKGIGLDNLKKNVELPTVRGTEKVKQIHNEFDRENASFDAIARRVTKTMATSAKGLLYLGTKTKDIHKKIKKKSKPYVSHAKKMWKTYTSWTKKKYWKKGK